MSVARRLSSAESSIKDMLFTVSSSVVFNPDERRRKPLKALSEEMTTEGARWAD